MLEQEPCGPITLKEFFPVNVVSCSELEGEGDEYDVHIDVQEASTPSVDDSPSCLRHFARAHELERNLPPARRDARIGCGCPTLCKVIC